MLVNNSGIDPDALLKNGSAVNAKQIGNSSSGVQYFTKTVGTTTVFVASDTIAVGQTKYRVSLVRDVSEETRGINDLAMKCALTGLAVTAAAAALIFLLIYQSLKPIRRLRSGAAELAHGRYESRIPAGGRDELSELAADFNGMADAIEASMDELREKTERQQTFINDLSHEMKTPVTSILLCAETLIGRKVPAETLNRSLERIYDQGVWLERLSQKLSTLVMLQGDIPLRQESVSKLLEAVETGTADALRESRMELLIDCRMDTLVMDFDLLRSALVNLVENARRAGEPGQSIEIHAYDDRIEVTDHGRGIPKEEIARVTEPFYTVDRSRSKKNGGAGLGLALVRQIAVSHGARLAIDSTPGRGTTMRLIFDQGKR